MHVYAVSGTYTISLTVSGVGGSAAATQDVVVSPQNVDVGIDVTVDNALSASDSDIAYLVSVTNNGAGNATGVVLTLTLPPDLTLSSAAASHGSYDAAVAIWALGDLPVGTTATLALQVHVGVVPSGTELTLSAVLNTLEQVDLDGSNNSDSQSVVVE
jgi:uncharacterized repeat protein (TIGR01451 family)